MNDYTDPKLTALAAMSAAEVAERIGLPLTGWEGNCYAVACKLVESGLMPTGTRAVYGHWRGPIAETSSFASRADIGLTGHGWTVTPDDQVIDPTRLAFEAVEPYIYFGSDFEGDIVELCRTCEHLASEHETGFLTRCEGGDMAGYDCGLCIFEPLESQQTRDDEKFYDEGGNAYAMESLRPFPALDVAKVCTDTAVPAEVAVFLATYGHHGGALTASQANWAANVPLALLGPAAKPLFEWLIAYCPTGPWMRSCARRSVELMPLTQRASIWWKALTAWLLARRAPGPRSSTKRATSRRSGWPQTVREEGWPDTIRRLEWKSVGYRDSRALPHDTRTVASRTKPPLAAESAYPEEAVRHGAAEISEQRWACYPGPDLRK